VIRLELGSNTVALTLSEKTTITNATYLFEFINNQTGQKYYCIAADTSLYTDRYNLFNIIVQVAAPDPLLGQLQLILGDEYTYNIYEQASTTNIDPALSGAIVETGMMTYDKDLTDREEYSNNDTRKAYEPS